MIIIFRAKKNIKVLLMILALVFTHILFINIRNSYSIDNLKTIKFAGDYNHPPYEYIDENGTYKGYNIDIIKAIANEMGLDIEIIPMEWNDAILALDNKEVEGIIGISQNQERLSKYKFTSPTIINEQVIFVGKDIVHINELNDLKGLKVAYQRNDYNESLIFKIPNVLQFPKGTQEEALISLKNGEVDAVLGNKLVGIYHLQKNKMTEAVKVVGEPISTVKYGLAVGRDNEELFRVLEKGLETIKKNKRYDRIYRKWFGEDISSIMLLYNIYGKQTIFIGVVVGLIFLFLYFYNKKLQKEVLKRTCELEMANEELIIHQKEIYNLAYYDSVTSLPNRIYFIEELNNLFETIHKKKNLFAVLLLDLDKFKHINDTLGHNIGDHVLKLLGTRLCNLVKEEDIVARIGGDEYFILMKNLNKDDDVINMVDAIIKDFKKPYRIKDYELYLTTSIGIALYPDGGLDSESMIKNADLALYKAKELGGNSYYFYGKEIQSKGLERMMLLNQLRQAVENNQLVLHYQPQIDIATGEITGLEALVRWNHPDKGLLYPDKFIPLAEETGLIIQIGGWILKEALNQGKEWIDLGYDIMVSVNISAKQFQRKEFIDELIKILKETGLNPKNLTLEITETTAISDISYTSKVLDTLKALGIAVAIDDFGTGYSSLNYLNQMSVSELKIDRSFIWDIEKNEKNKMISNTIIVLAKQLGLKVTAEGVENTEQLHILKEMKCDTAQGYYFSKPVSKEKIYKMINEKSPI
ncbi:diguanylate cyclase (GGDEF)-like protein [Tissierella praeacuta]|uniref:EAL domain-containing protein n=1 Tax=Tissierella praeacuta TaxID=43131 RepID=UPI0010526328|nr:EAL domain-containing protein [Tissierella praeacuta]TCU77412.1 diguanylate cyclase (GGDEF)-like protein [Tissierella praeacuta]